MSGLIKDIKILDDCYSVKNGDSEDQEENPVFLSNLSKINIFVGQNNSGKSRFLRSFVNSSELEFVPNDPDLLTLNEKIIPALKTKIRTFNNRLPQSAIKRELNATLEKINPLNTLKNGENLDPMRDILNFAEKYKRQSGTNIGNFSYGQIGVTVENLFFESFNDFIPFDDLNLLYVFKKIYIPTLRGLRPLGQDDYYNKRTFKDYFSSVVVDEEAADNHMVIFTGFEAYEKVKSLLLGRLEERKLITNYQNFLSEQFFDNKEVTLIPDLDEEGILRVKIGDEKEKEIYNLGDGIQSIIIMTLPLFVYQEEFKGNILIFIEEPEIFLHPGLQRNLIDIFLDERFNNVQFFFTTHSNHFLDITFDFDNISIFTLRKELDNSDEAEKDPKFLIENVSQGDQSALELLGVKNSSVFLSNCTIWVEGITDRYYIKRYFDKFQEFKKENNENFVDFREDYHYSFVEYGGNNITHWSFLDDEEELDDKDRINVENLCAKLFLVADDDNAEGKKARRLEKLRENLDERFYSLESKEIENTLSKKVLLEIIKDYECNDNERDELEYSDDFDEESYKNEPLGEFIENTILNGNKKRLGSYKDGKTITGKVDFCKKALDHINSYEDLSKEAKCICELLYEFISRQNGYDTTVK